MGDAEQTDLALAGASSISELRTKHPWIVATGDIASHQGFFHWQLEFATVFGRGGFDLQVGNPPWVRPRSDVDALLAEGDPWWQLKGKTTQERERKQRALTLEVSGVVELLLDGTSEVAALSNFVGSPSVYPLLTGLQPDLYRCFMERAWHNTSGSGVVSLIHPETHFTDENAGQLRGETYSRLRRHWHFINKLMLFEVSDHVVYGVHVYGASREYPSFKTASWIYTPETVNRSLTHDGSGPEPGLKTPEGTWDLRPHRARIVDVTPAVLETWHALLEESTTPVRHSRMVYTVNSAAAKALVKLASRSRIQQLSPSFASGWHEKNDRTKGFIEVQWGAVEEWPEVIIQGPHIHVLNGFFKEPNPTMKHNQDWSLVDLELLSDDHIPVTSHKRAAPGAEYAAAYAHWGSDRVPARDHYRVVWRYMAANTGERTLISALIPPGTAPTHGLNSLGLPGRSARELTAVAATLSSLVSDFQVRAAPKSNIPRSVISRLALPDLENDFVIDQLVLRALRLNCQTQAYAQLWSEAWSDRFLALDWLGGDSRPGRQRLGAAESAWSRSSPLRVAIDRRQALLEIDVILAHSLSLDIDELIGIYRAQFAVLYGYDKNSYFYDRSGRIVPNEVLVAWRQSGSEITEAQRTMVNSSGNSYTYELPFVTLDREADMRQAYAHFQRLLQERS